MVMGIVSRMDAVLARKTVAGALPLSLDTGADKHGGIDGSLPPSVPARV
jgi:hypothetical protein